MQITQLSPAVFLVDSSQVIREKDKFSCSCNEFKIYRVCGHVSAVAEKLDAKLTQRVKTVADLDREVSLFRTVFRKFLAEQ